MIKENATLERTLFKPTWVTKFRLTFSISSHSRFTGRILSSSRLTEYTSITNHSTVFSFFGKSLLMNHTNNHVNTLATLFHHQGLRYFLMEYKSCIHLIFLCSTLTQSRHSVCVCMSSPRCISLLENKPVLLGDETNIRVEQNFCTREQCT